MAFHFHRAIDASTPTLVAGNRCARECDDNISLKGNGIVRSLEYNNQRENYVLCGVRIAYIDITYTLHIHMCTIHI